MPFAQWQAANAAGNIVAQIRVGYVSWMAMLLLCTQSFNSWKQTLNIFLLSYLIMKERNQFVFAFHRVRKFGFYKCYWSCWLEFHEKVAKWILARNGDRISSNLRNDTKHTFAIFPAYLCKAPFSNQFFKVMKMFSIQKHQIFSQDLVLDVKLNKHIYLINMQFYLHVVPAKVIWISKNCLKNKFIIYYS